MLTKIRGYAKQILQQLKLIEPKQTLNDLLKAKTNVDVKALGSPYGAWSVPITHLHPHAVCYCFGAGEDISFDLELLQNYNCNVYTFDPTPRAIDHVQNVLLSGRVTYSDQAYQLDNNQPGTLHFHDWGIWEADAKLRFYQPSNTAHVSHSVLNLQKTDKYFEAQCYTLKTIMQKLGHDQIDLLKLDIEGAEYSVINDMLRDGIYPRILCVEFDEGHNALDSEFLKRIQTSIDQLHAVGYRAVAVNLWDVTFVATKTDTEKT